MDTPLSYRSARIPTTLIPENNAEPVLGLPDTGAGTLDFLPPKPKLDGIEALRGLAAVAVVGYHASRHLNKAFGAPELAALFQPGQAGVDMFFTLSGFIILHVHRKDIGRPARLAHYLERRATRVFPLYWVALAVTVVMGLIGSHTLPGAGRLLVSALLLPVRQEPLLGVAWTLQFEVMFYAAFAVLILNRALGCLLLAGWFICIACGICGIAPAGLPPQVTGIYGLEFFLGMASALILQTGSVRRPRVVAGAGAILFLVALVVAAPLAGEYGAAARFMYGVPASMIVLGLACLAQAGAGVVPAWAMMIGSSSYSIYLFQFVFIGAAWVALRASGFDQRIGVPGLFVILSASAVAGGVLASQLIEKPLLRMLRR